MTTFPDDVVQRVVAPSPWWEPCDCDVVEPGALLLACLPHVDQQPYILIPEGRKNPEEHRMATVRIEPFDVKQYQQKPKLPVAALTLNAGEIWATYRAKRRPCLVVGKAEPVNKSLSRDMPKKSTSPAMVVAPYYGVDRDGSRAGYNPELVKRIRHAEYPQFILDSLPITSGKKTEQSLLRLDHLQPVGTYYRAFVHTGFCLSVDARELVLRDWLDWFLWDDLSETSLLRDFQKLVSES